MRRKVYVLVLVLAVLAMVQRPAYAMTARIPWGDLSGDWAYCAGKHTDAYSAAAELVGYDLSSLTKEQRTALLDVNGTYVAYGQLAERLSTLSQVADDFGGAVTSFFQLDGWFELMGLDEIWVYRAANDDLIEQAALDIQECIAEHPRATGNPDVGGGGGGSGGGSGGDEITQGNVTYTILDAGQNGVNGLYVLNAVFGTGTVSVDLSKNIARYPQPANTTIAVYSNRLDNTQSTGKFGFTYLPEGVYIGYVTGTTPTTSNLYCINTTDVRITVTSYFYSYFARRSDGVYETSNASLNSNANYISANSATGIRWFLDDSLNTWSYHAGGGTVTPPYTPTQPQYPDNDIPDPTNITLPNITLPNITLPNLNPPSTQPSNPTYNTYTYNTYNTATGEDVIPYLRNIIEWLGEIDLDIVSGHNALGDIMDGVNTQIRQQVKWLFDSLDVELDAGVTAINTTMRTLVDSLAGLINDAFEDSFYDLKVWLKQALTKIQDEIGDFDDDMLYQLKLIRRKMGGGRSSEPSPKDEPDDWLKWWSDLISKLLEKLADALPDELLELVEDFKALSSKFPFSIPWDIAFLVGLFAHAPVTPVFDYPVPYGYANGQVLVASVHVDMSPWDGVALAIRNTQLVGFAIWLAFNTSKLSTYLKLPGSGSKGD